MRDFLYCGSDSSASSAVPRPGFGRVHTFLQQKSLWEIRIRTNILEILIIFEKHLRSILFFHNHNNKFKVCSRTSNACEANRWTQTFLFWSIILGSIIIAWLIPVFSRMRMFVSMNAVLWGSNLCITARNTWSSVVLSQSRRHCAQYYSDGPTYL